MKLRSKIVTRLLGTLALAALVGCPAKTAAPTRRQQGAPATFAYPKGEKIPGYEGLAVGQTFDFTLLLRSKRTDIVKAITDTEIVLERRTWLAGQLQEPREVHEPLVSSGEAFLPGGANLGVAFKKIAEDQLTVSGQGFDCDVYEAKGPGQVARYWVAARYPFVIRSTANGTTTLELTEIMDHPPAPKVPDGKAIKLGSSPAAADESSK